MKKIIGIDIGGTCIKADLYSTEGQSLNNYKEVSTHIDYENKTNDILEQVCNLIRSYTRENEISGVAISSAGVVNSNTGEIIYAGYTIPGYIGTDFTTEINKQFKLPVSVENDVNCAALGEAWLGKAKGIKTAAMITVGTGIGGSIIINGKIFNGSSYTAGEVGYLPIKGQDWQNIASTTSLVKNFEKKTGKENQDGRSFFKELADGNTIAKEVLDEFIDNLTDGILTISYLINPEVFIIGGGIFSNPDMLLTKIQVALNKKVQDKRFLPKKVLAASLGNEAGRIGAVKHFLNQHT